MIVPIYILDAQDFVGVSDISGFISTDRLEQYTGITQAVYAYKMLCEETYTILLDQLAQGEEYLDPEYAALLLYLKRYLIFKTVSRYLINSGVISTAAGMRSHTDTVSNDISQEKYAELLNQATSDAAFYQDQLNNFLIKNQDDYPEWKASNCNCKNNFSKLQNRFSFGGGRRNPYSTKIRWT